MANVKFNLKDPNTQDETLIYLFYRYDGKRLKYSTQEKINPNFWVIKDQRVKEDHPRSFELNTHLDNLENFTKNIYRKFKNDGKVPTTQEFKTELNLVTLRSQETTQLKTLFSFIDYFITEREKQPRYNKRTIDIYKVIQGILERYAQKRKRSLDFGDITLEFYNDFLEFLYSDPNEFSINYAGNIIKVLKTILNDATERGINTNLTFRSKYFKKPTQDTDSIYLNLHEITNIFNLDFSNNPKLDRVRDLFILGCFTGLRFSDFTQINPENIKLIYDVSGNPVEVISLTTQKTDDKVVIPLHPFVSSILKKYDTNIPNPLSNQKMNDYLKDVCREAKFNEIVQLTKSKGGKPIKVVKKKSDLVSTHTARRSFATNAFKSGVPSISIMKITGHKTEKSFMKYIKISEDENAVLMAQSRFFKGENILKAI